MLAGKLHPNLRADGGEGRTKQVLCGFSRELFRLCENAGRDRHGHVSTLIGAGLQTDQDAPGIK